MKISEGCDHGCAFCAIPLMRGKHRSFALDEVVREAQLLELEGAREINLVAQDLAHYGRDRRDGVQLPELLEALIAETSIPWIRMLYLYSAGITDRLLEVVAGESRVLPYLDMPIQHGSDLVLARMRRPERKRTIRERVKKFRDAVPDVAIRTTCIVGFPGETEEQFEELLGFLEEMQFERVGAFTYSPQEGTRAAQYPDDVNETIKRERLERLTELQRAITGEKYESRIGRTALALVDRSDAKRGTSQARLPWQADDIDGVTQLDEALAPGTIDASIQSAGNCLAAQPACGFTADTTAIVFDASGCRDVVRIDDVTAGSVLLRSPAAACTFSAGAAIAQGEVRSYRVDPLARQLLRRDEATGISAPVLDGVAALHVDYFGAGIEGGALPLDGFSDGPWAGGVNVFDVDLLRIRRVRVVARRLPAPGVRCWHGTRRDRYGPGGIPSCQKQCRLASAAGNLRFGGHTHPRRGWRV